MSGTVKLTAETKVFPRGIISIGLKFSGIMPQFHGCGSQLTKIAISDFVTRYIEEGYVTASSSDMMLSEELAAI